MRYTQKSPIQVHKPHRLTAVAVLSFVLVLGGAVAALVSWLVIFKPSDQFGHYKARIIFGNSAGADGVNLVRIGESARPYVYEFYYEIDGKTYIKNIERWPQNSFPEYMEFDYRVDDPNYTVSNRAVALAALPIVFAVLSGVNVLIVRVYIRERKRLGLSRH